MLQNIRDTNGESPQMSFVNVHKNNTGKKIVHYVFFIESWEHFTYLQEP